MGAIAVRRRSNYKAQRYVNAEAMLQTAFHSTLPKRVDFASPFNVTAENQSFTFMCFLERNRGICSSTGRYDAGFFYGKHDHGSSLLKGITIFTHTQTNTATEQKIAFFVYLGDGTQLSNVAIAKTAYVYSTDCLYHFALTVSQVHDIRTYTMYINGMQAAVSYTYQPFTASAVVSNTSDKLGWGEYNSQSYGHNGTLAHACICNKILTQQEIAYHAATAKLLTSAHESVQAYLPLTQPNGKIAYNAVEQYNYAKTTNITAVHSNLINYSDDEAGDVFCSSNKVWKEFYLPKGIYQANAYRMFNPSNADNAPSAPDSTDMQFGTGDFEYEIKLKFASFQASTTAEYLHLFDKVVDGSDRQLFTYHMAKFKLYMAKGSTKVVATQAYVNELCEIGKVHTIRFKKLTTNPANWKILIDGKEVAVLLENNGTFTDDILSNTAPAKFLYGSSVTEFLVHEMKLWKAGVLMARWSWNNRAGSKVFDLVGQNHISIPSYYYTSHGSRHWIEKKSEKCPVANALRFNKAQSQYLTVPNFVPTGENGYTMIAGFALESSRNFDSAWHDHFLSKRKSVSGDYRYIGYAGLYSTDAKNVIYLRDAVGAAPYEIKNRLKALNLLISTWKRIDSTSYLWELYLNGELVHSAIRTNMDFYTTTFDQLPGDLAIGADIGFIGTRHLDGYLFYTAIAKGIITAEQVAELNNNTLYLQPNKDWTNLDWQLLVNFNRIINTSGVYTLEDLSGKGHTITLRNFTSNNVTPGDAAYSLTPLNNLR